MRVEEGFQLVGSLALYRFITVTHLSIQTSHLALHPYTDDPVLSNLLQRLLPTSIKCKVDQDLVRFGDDIRGSIRDISSLIGPPKLTQYDQWGRRIDRLDTSEGWRKLKEIAIREGLVSIPHEREYREFSRVYGFAKSFIFSGDSHVVLCPISMTDGSARVLELFGTDEMKRDIRSRLISRDPSVAFTSGQWMTERPGGSDISQTETTATFVAGNSGQASTTVGAPYTLNGFKWFSSATDSEVAVALARTGPLSLGSQSLSLFLVPLRFPLFPTPETSPVSNGVFIHRLKNKIGTYALPTAELSLSDSKAFLLGPLNEGVRSIAPVLNITRIYSAVTLVGSLSRALAIARSYATVRSVIIAGPQSINPTKRLLKDMPLHMSVLAKVGITYHALAHLTFGAVTLLGKSECGVSDIDEEVRLRLLTPSVKAFVSDRAVTAMEDCMACLGGQGYMEENDIGRLIRDCSVDRIWEGTISVPEVLALDLIRASRSDRGIAPFIEWATKILASTPVPLQKNLKLDSSICSLKRAVDSLEGAFAASKKSHFLPRPLLFLFAHSATALYLLEHSVWASHNREMYADWIMEFSIFRRWVDEGLDNLRNEVEKAKVFGHNGEREREDSDIVYGATPSGPSYTHAKL
ncbi:hypothetical protein K439DRAFT_1622395 [Ramaria rubella]|nr:hypothetical protein K439DRAFT_1622395 [Ramaria rubella]